MADAHPEIEEMVRAWLRGSPAPRTTTLSAALEESQELRTDPLVGDALIESHRAEEAMALATAEVVPALQLYDPGQIPALDRLVGRTRALTNLLRQLAGARRLGLLGSIGTEIDFSPKYFMPTGGQRNNGCGSSVPRWCAWNPTERRAR